MTNPTGIEWLDCLIALGCVFSPCAVLLILTSRKDDV